LETKICTPIFTINKYKKTAEVSHFLQNIPLTARFAIHGLLNLVRRYYVKIKIRPQELGLFSPERLSNRHNQSVKKAQLTLGI